MTEHRLIKKVFEAFGPCSTMFECSTLEEVNKDFEEQGLPLQDWLDLQLSVEDGSGTPISMLAEIEERLDVLLQLQGLEPMRDSRKYRRLDLGDVVEHKNEGANMPRKAICLDGLELGTILEGLAELAQQVEYNNFKMTDEEAEALERLRNRLKRESNEKFGTIWWVEEEENDQTKEV